MQHVQKVNPEGSLPYSQRPATCHREPDKSNPRPPTPIASKSVLILSSHLRLGLPSCVDSSSFTMKILYAFLLSTIRDVCPTHLMRFDLITRIVFGEQCRSLSSSLCSLLHSPVTSPLLYSNIFLSTLFSKTLCVPPSVWETKFRAPPKKT